MKDGEKSKLAAQRECIELCKMHLLECQEELKDKRQQKQEGLICAETSVIKCLNVTDGIDLAIFNLPKDTAIVQSKKRTLPDIDIDNQFSQIEVTNKAIVSSSVS